MGVLERFFAIYTHEHCWNATFVFDMSNQVRFILVLANAVRTRPSFIWFAAIIYNIIWIRLYNNIVCIYNTMNINILFKMQKKKDAPIHSYIFEKSNIYIIPTQNQKFKFTLNLIIF